MTAPVLRTARLVSAYRRYLITADAPRFAAEVGQYYSTATLLRVLNDGGVELRRAAALALGVLGDVEAIEPLGRRLADEDRGVRLAADDSFRGLMVREGAAAQQHRLLRVMHLNDGGEFAAALAPALILTDHAPDYAEAHHQLAICWLGLGDFAAAEQALRCCLWYRRFHYAAWVGLAHCRLQGEDPDGDDLRMGLTALRRAIAICPDLESPRLELRRLERAIEEQQPGSDRLPYRPGFFDEVDPLGPSRGDDFFDGFEPEDD
ncbi:HEAT repeat domain-containing protein [Planctomycetaceae bacterium SH139]